VSDGESDHESGRETVGPADRADGAGTSAPVLAPVLSMALAMDRNRLIGANGALPWHIPGELAHFKRVTMGKPIVMGRKTFESIGRPLPGRPNLVVTRDARWRAEGVTAFTSLEAALEAGRQEAIASGVDELVVIGGAALCRDAMPHAERFHLTLVDAEFEGDTWLDTFEWSRWREVSRQSPDPESTGGTQVHYLELERLER